MKRKIKPGKTIRLSCTCPELGSTVDIKCPLHGKGGMFYVGDRKPFPLSGREPVLTETTNQTIMPTIKIYYLKDKHTGDYVAHMDRHSTRTINGLCSAYEYIFDSDAEAEGYCKAIKVLTGQSFIPVRKRKNM